MGYEFIYTFSMAKKIRVGILFGGKSAEHEISVRSAKNIADAIDKNKFEVVLLGIDKRGGWHLETGVPKLLVSGKEDEVSLMPEKGGALMKSGTVGAAIGTTVDVVFPILHGPFGEDGTVQGLLRLAGVPFVGASVLGSAVGMDKDIMKRLLRDADIPIGKFLTFRPGEKIDFKHVSEKLGLPLFIKPANLGSSVGVSKVRDEEEFKKAVEEAFSFDSKILVEEFIEGREVECAVLGNEDPVASLPGEVIVNADFYSYEAKYIDENGATLKIPAEVTEEEKTKIQKTALDTFKALNCEGLARVDSFLTKDGKVIVNEINTMPGFTSISMYPKLFEASGISYTDLITKLIELAQERFEKEAKLKTSYVV